MDLKEIAEAGQVRHPWERHRFELYLELLKARVPPSHHTVLDVGAGDGFFASELQAAWPSPLEICCWDSGYGDAPLDAPAAAMSRTALQPSARFDLILMLDVAEHVADDRAFLDGIVARNLAPDGQLLLAVPAWPALWTSHDARLGHFRRYTPASGRSLCEGAGLRVIASGGLFPSLVPLRALQKLSEKVGRAPVSGLDRTSSDGAVAKVIDVLLTADRRVQRALRALSIDLPGLSWWALCTR